ncbi:SRPBCC family protein [Microbacterium rhizomatis]|uniref:SRPBCC domain-containing protein n=1 Tax=Microbacterium rhizomatis TaxID=1631477 RepID=A0A5J5J5V6_9MICO|nr:SRPBCC domain-containing protein [Microbacterium rhizomatis]KAA9111536.1 SRPBCC domain-containing protein [Microbacterium rhizomatis]
MTESITVTRTFAAPRELVWEAFTAPQHFASWFGTDAVEVPLDTLVWNAAPGSAWSAVMHLPDGTTKDWVGEFVEVDAPSRLVFTLTDVPEHPENAAPTTVSLTEADGGTIVTLTQETPGFTPEQQAGVTAGYGAFLDTLGRVVLGL